MDENRISRRTRTNRATEEKQAPPTPTMNEAEANQGGGEGKENDITARAGEIASETVEQAQRLGATARERLYRGADERKQTLVRGLDQLAHNIDELGVKSEEEAGDLPVRIAGSAADALRRVSRSLSSQSTEELIDAAGRKIRERPGMFLVGCVALGYLGARLLRR